MEEQVRDARNDPWLDAKLAVRRWDDRAKDPEMEVPGLDAYEDMAVRCLVGEYKYNTDC
jgi:predicted HD phosphohydrolase